MSVLAQLERLDDVAVGRPEAPYVRESRQWRLRLVVVGFLAFVSLLIAVAAEPVGWALVAFALGTGVKTWLARRAWRATVATTVSATGRWYEI